MNNNLRFISQNQLNEGIEYYHVARCALSDKPLKEQSKYHRILYACRWLHKKYPDISETAFYKDLESNLYGY
jgi:hypothetical protein